MVLGLCLYVEVPIFILHVLVFRCLYDQVDCVSLSVFLLGVCYVCEV